MSVRVELLTRRNRPNPYYYPLYETRGNPLCAGNRLYVRLLFCSNPSYANREASPFCGIQ